MSRKFVEVQDVVKIGADICTYCEDRCTGGRWKDQRQGGRGGQVNTVEILQGRTQVTALEILIEILYKYL